MVSTQKVLKHIRRRKIPVKKQVHESEVSGREPGTKYLLTKDQPHQPGCQKLIFTCGKKVIVRTRTSMQPLRSLRQRMN
jgi:hypothetical protein